MKNSLLTTATIDYVPYALITFRSAKKTCSFENFYIFVADAKPKSFQKLKDELGEDASWINLISLEEIDSTDRSNFLKTFEYYSKGEIANLSKYIAIKHVLRNTDTQRCVFVDSDMLFFEDICVILNEKCSKAVYLTPQISKPTEARFEHEVMIHGWINAGFMVYNKDFDIVFDILDYLINRISKRGFIFPENSLTFDQTWVGALPILFHQDVTLCEVPGINVAYWNLSGRKITKLTGNRFQVNNSPLILFHYSGYDFKNKNKLSIHSEIIAEKDSPLYELCSIYEREFMKVNEIHKRVKDLESIKASEQKLFGRIRTSKRINSDVNLYLTGPEPGIFTRIGKFLDSATRRLKS